MKNNTNNITRVRKSDVDAIIKAKAAAEKAEQAKARIREILPAGSTVAVGDYVVTVNRGTPAGETLDTARLRKANPALWASLIAEYGKPTAERQGAVIVKALTE